MPAGGVVVVATRVDLVDDVMARLGLLGAHGLDKIELTDRTLCEGSFGNVDRAGVAAASLRDGGWAAVARPAAGAHLDHWRRQTALDVVTERLALAFPWSEVDRGGDSVVVDIDPGQAFGAGRHPSTRLLLVELSERLGGGETVLDVGCGSGVLAIAAARLGAHHVGAVDVDGRAVVATTVNAEWNGVRDVVDAATTPVADVDGSFDVVVANIGAATLIEMAVPLVARVAPGGWLGLSGISPAQVSVVAAAFRPLGVVDVRRGDDWSAVVLAAASTIR